jgi:hypothetical protein
MLQFLRKSEPPPNQLKRTYQNELRALGRHCDDHQYRSIGIYEVSEGFILRAFTDISNPDSVEAIEVPDTDIQTLILKNFTARRGAQLKSHSPLCPTGYEDFLRALGYELEVNQAKAVAIQEMVDVMAVTYLQQQSTSSDSYVWEPRSVNLTASDIQELVDEAFRRRGSAS